MKAGTSALSWPEEDFVRLITTVIVAVLCLSASPLQAAEGVLILERTVTGTNTRTSQIQIEPERMRAEMTGQAGESQVVVFDGPQQVLRLISTERKSYTEMTKADVERMGAQMVQMKEKLAQMPPAQRAQMEAMMGRMGGRAGMGAAPVKTEYRRAGSDKVGKWTCAKYEGFQGDQKVSEVCTVEPKALGFVAADFEISKQLASFFETLVPQGSEQIFSIGTPDTQGFSGIPVRRISYSDGKVRSTSEMEDVRRQTFDASSYEVPAGFQKQTPGRR